MPFKYIYSCYYNNYVRICTISDCMQTFMTSFFNTALVRQAGCIPCNYFAHLVESNNRVIFTGLLDQLLYS